LQVIIGSTIAEGLVSIVSRLGLGLLLGLIGGLVIALLLRVEHVVPEGLENVSTLSLVVALFFVSNALLPESGVMSVTAAGMVVGNFRTRVQRDLLEFKEQLTVMLIGMLFVLLAAQVRIADVRALGLAGVATVAALMLVVRPLDIAVCTWGSGLSRRERLFLSWISPRGVVAAAVATVFAQAFEVAGIPGGTQLQALVFMVIAGTVVIQGLTGGTVARLLHLRKPDHQGWAILGANEVGLTIARLLRMSGEEVVFVDSKVVMGNVIHERTLQRAQLDDRAACIAVTPNEEINLLFARSAREEFKVPRIAVAVGLNDAGVNPTIVKARGADVLFGAPRDVGMWSVRLRRGFVVLESWRLEKKPARTETEGSGEGAFDFPRARILPLVVGRGDGAFAVHGGKEFRKGDRLHVAVYKDELAEAHAWLEARDWAFVESLDPTAPVAGVTPGPVGVS